MWTKQRRLEAAKADTAAELPQGKLERLRHEIEAQFRSADSNGDGFLSPDEPRGQFPGIAREFRRADSDADGRISMREFLQVRRMQLERRLKKEGG